MGTWAILDLCKCLWISINQSEQSSFILGDFMIYFITIP